MDPVIDGGLKKYMNKTAVTLVMLLPLKNGATCTADASLD